MEKIEKRDLKEFNARASLIDLYGETLYDDKKNISYSNIMEEIIRLSTKVVKYEEVINELFYSANSLQADAAGIVDEITDLQDEIKER
jgi:uncharacterized coiled-coil DUF342 family protein